MKRILAVLLALLLIVASVGCKKKDKTQEPLPDELVEDSSLMEDGTYQGIGRGHNGTISLELTIANNEISAIDILEHKETRTIGGIAIQKIPQQIVEYQSPQVDTVAGATTTSTAILSAVEEALILAGANTEFLNTYNVPEQSSPLSLGSSAYNYDVVVIGAGGAGLTAAISAAESGASVAVIEQNGFPGGGTAQSYGRISAPNHTLGDNNDSTEKYLEDILEYGEEKQVRVLAETMAKEALPAVTWLESLGMEWKSAQSYKGHTNSRTLVSNDGTGEMLIDILVKEAEHQGVEFFYETKANRLVKDGNRIVGVEATSHFDTATIGAKSGVVIATGGFVSNGGLRIELTGENYKRVFPCGSPYSNGDFIQLTEDLDVKMYGTSYLQLTPFGAQKYGGVSPIAEVLNHGGFVVNEQGAQVPFDKENSDNLITYMKESGFSTLLVVWDDEIAKNANLEELSVELEILKTNRELVVGDTLEQAGKKAPHSLDILALLETQVQMNYQPVGQVYISPISTGSLYTLGGLAVNTNAQVLDDSDAPISGLYAAGEAIGGMHGTQALEGNMLTSLLVFGRIAGNSAAS